MVLFFWLVVYQSALDMTIQRGTQDRMRQTPSFCDDSSSVPLESITRERLNVLVGYRIVNVNMSTKGRHGGITEFISSDSANHSQPYE